MAAKRQSRSEPGAASVRLITVHVAAGAIAGTNALVRSNAVDNAVMSRRRVRQTTWNEKNAAHLRTGDTPCDRCWMKFRESQFTALTSRWMANVRGEVIRARPVDGLTLQAMFRGRDDGDMRHKRL